MILDEDPLVNHIVAFFEWIKKVHNEHMPKHHDATLRKNARPP